MTVTKSIRLEPEEVKQVQAVVGLMPGASEAAALKHLLFLGLGVHKRDLAVLLYTRDGLSTGEIAERLDMSRLDVLQTLAERHVKVFDPPADLFEEALRGTDLPGAWTEPSPRAPGP